MNNIRLVTAKELKIDMIIEPSDYENEYEWKIIENVRLASTPANPTKRFAIIRCENINTKELKVFKLPAASIVKVLDKVEISDQGDNKDHQH